MWLRPEITLLFLPRCVLGYRNWSRVNSALLLSPVLSEIGLGKKQREKDHMDLIIRKWGHLKVRHGQLEECWWPRWYTVSRESPWRCMDQINQAKKENWLKKLQWCPKCDLLDWQLHNPGKLQKTVLFLASSAIEDAEKSNFLLCASWLWQS